MTDFHHLLVQFELNFCTLYSEWHISRKARAPCAVLLLKYRREEFPSTHWSQLAVERWRGGLSMALTFYFSGNCRIQPWSFPGGVRAFNSSLCRHKDSAASSPAHQMPPPAHKEGSMPMQLLAR